MMHIIRAELDSVIVGILLLLKCCHFLLVIVRDVSLCLCGYFWCRYIILLLNSIRVADLKKGKTIMACYLGGAPPIYTLLVA
jgi:hypothetical protein